MKQYLKTIVYLAAALVSVACSSGGDNDPSSFKSESYNGVVSRGNSYEGIWMVTLKFRGMPCQVRQRFSAFRFRRLQI